MEFLAVGDITDDAVVQICFHRVALADSVHSFRTLYDRQTDVDRVPVEDAGKALGNDQSNAAFFDCDRGMLTGRTAAEVFAADHDVAVFDAVEALAPDAPVIFPGKFKSGTNEVAPGVPHFQPDGPWWQMKAGDPAKGFEEAEWVAESLVEFNKMPAPNAPEPPGAIVRWEGGGDYTLWVTSQSPYICKLYNAPRIPHSNLRIKTFNAGGSYGNKQSRSVTILCAALAARVTGRPVQNFMS